MRTCSCQKVRSIQQNEAWLQPRNSLRSYHYTCDRQLVSNVPMTTKRLNWKEKLQTWGGAIVEHQSHRWTNLRPGCGVDFDHRRFDDSFRFETSKSAEEVRVLEGPRNHIRHSYTVHKAHLRCQRLKAQIRECFIDFYHIIKYKERIGYTLSPQWTP